MNKINNFQLGNKSINRLGFGTMRATTGPGIWGDTADKAQAIKVIRAAIEQGVNFIDTADSYGPYTSELLVAEAIAPFKNEVMLATKGGAVKYQPGAILANGHPYYLQTAVEGSLRRLKREQIELYFLHRVDPNIPIEESVGALRKMQNEGKIKHIGLSNVSKEQLIRAQQVAPIAAVQNAFSYQDRRYAAVVDYAGQEGIAFVAHTPVARNNWTPEVLKLAAQQGISVHQLSLSWLLEYGEHVIVIPGTASLKHLKENMASAQLNWTAVHQI